MAKKKPKWQRPQPVLKKLVRKYDSLGICYTYMQAIWNKQDRVTGKTKRARILWKQQRRRDEVRRIFGILKLGSPY